MFGEYGFGGLSQFTSDPFSVNPSSQNEKTPGKSRKSTVAKRENDPGCFPVTIVMIKRAIERGDIKSGKCTINGKVFGVAEIVGWVLTKDSRQGFTELKITDGTGPINVLLEARVQDEDWFAELVDPIVVGSLIRVIGSINPDNPPKITAVHFRKATYEEYAFLFPLQLVATALKCQEISGVDFPQGGDDAKANVKLQQPKDIKLPADYVDAETLCEKHVIQTVLDIRKENVGADISAIKKQLADCFTDTDIAGSIESLQNKGVLLETVENFVDSVFST